MVNSYKDLIVWQKAMALTEMIYALTQSFPKEEVYGLKSQVRRAAVSVPSNIAEGNARNSQAEYIQFLSIARGSLAEVETQLILAERFGYISREKNQSAFELQVEVGKMINTIIRKLKEERHR
jgi:four helix bundle protein